MTTPADFTLQATQVLAAVNDRDTLQLVTRLVEANVTLLEAQLAQHKQLQSAIAERTKALGKK